MRTAALPLALVLPLAWGLTIAATSATAQAPEPPASVQQPPAVQQPPSAQSARRAAIGHLLDTLHNAATEGEAAAAEERLEHLWLEQGSPSVTLLMVRGIRDLGAGANQDAFDDFDAAIVLDATVPAAWQRRALARYQSGDSRGAVRDLEQAVQLEPRYFPAFRTLEQIAENRQDWKSAYAAWLKVMEIAPKTPGGAEKLKDLKRRAFGDVT